MKPMSMTMYIFDSGKVFYCKAVCLAKMIAAVLHLFTKPVMRADVFVLFLFFDLI